MRYEDVVVGVSCLIIGVFVGLAIGDYAKYNSHLALGSKGYSCFANNTCRENLKCIMPDGIKPVCVGK